MRTLMCSRGESMTEEEVNKMIGFAADKDGKIFYVGAGVVPSRGPCSIEQSIAQHSITLACVAALQPMSMKFIE